MERRHDKIIARRDSTQRDKKRRLAQDYTYYTLYTHKTVQKTRQGYNVDHDKTTTRSRKGRNVAYFRGRNVTMKLCILTWIGF